MGRKKVIIAKIQDKATRTITFTKRRQGLFKKAGELCVLCDVEVAILTFSLAGKPFAFSHPNIDSLLHRFNCKQPTLIDSSNANVTIPSLNPQLEHHVHNSSSSNNGNGNENGYWWDLVNVDDFVDESNLQQLKNTFERLKQGIYARLLAFDLSSCNGSTPVTSPFAHVSIPGGVCSSSLPGNTIEACNDLCDGLSEIIMQGNFGGQILDFEISNNLPQVTDMFSKFQDF